MNRFTLNRTYQLFCFSILLIFIINSTIFSQSTNIRFQHLSVESGMAGDRFNCLVQDRLGFIWFGTSNGISKYDGYNFENYVREEADSTGLIGINIRSIMEDSEGDIWAGTYYGISILLRDENRFVSYEYDKDDITSLSNNWVQKMFQDSNGNVWIGTRGGGLNFIEKTSFLNKRKKLIFQRINLPNYVEGTENVSEIFEDSKGLIWVCTTNGLLKISGKDLELIQAVESNNYNNKNYFLSIVEDNAGYFWIGTQGNGIILFNPESHEFNFINDTEQREENYSSSNIRSLLIDKNGNLWAGSNDDQDGGLYLYDRTTNKYSKFFHNPLNPHSISKEYGPIRAIVQDNFENIWIPIHHGKVNIIFPHNQFHYHRNYNIDKNSILFSKKTKIMESKDGRIWFGAENGLFEYMPAEDGFKKIIAVDKIENCSSEQRCQTLIEDLIGNIWLAGMNTELRKYNPQNGSLMCFESSSDMHMNNVSSFISDKSGIIWLGSYGSGLTKYNSFTEQVTKYKHIYTDTTTISSNYIITICEDSSNSIWISTGDQWLNKLDKKTGTVKRIKFSESHGHFSNLFVDSKNRLWTGTSFKGIYLFDTKNDDYKAINKSHGLPSNLNLTGFSEDYNGNIYCCTGRYLIKFNQSGEFEGSYAIGTEDEYLHQTYSTKITKQIFVISNKGFYHFSIDSLKPNMIPPKMVLTDIKFKDKSIEVGKNSPLKKHINVAQEIELEYWQNDLTIQFAGINFNNQNDNRYKYILENYDNDWREAGVSREATYTNLEYGKYLFKAIGSNSSGKWANEAATLSIMIYPPWWVTWWAYLIYTVIFVIVLSVVFLLQKKRIQTINRIEIKEFEAQKLREIDQMKSKFFENISHEFRTPLTLIKGPIERLLNNENVDDPKKIYKMIKRNSDKLFNLINELLDLSKLETGNLKLNAHKTDIVVITKDIVMSFESLAQKKGIELTINSSNDIIEFHFDKEKIQKILNNLLSNSFKFTPYGGKISVALENNIEEKTVLIKVIDTGIGISNHELPKIFDRFYQATHTITKGVEGTGIGLSLTKELVELHHGKISVQSEMGKGSVFIVELPLGKEHLSDKELVHENIVAEQEEELHDTFDLAIEENSLPLVLIVEDNNDLREFIKTILKKDYRLIEARNGKEGYQNSLTHMPDLIISDVMMPILDGDAMCKKLKSDQITAHIPVILLTAKSTSDDRINGLEVGADDYLVKPFNEKELLIRISNLITQRRVLREKYLREAEVHPSDIAVTSVDKAFINKVMEIVEKNLADRKFSVEQMASDMAMSRTQLYRKFVQILGEKPSDFIKKYRIRRAADLIEQRFGNITDVAYEVGFDSISYFSKCFKQIYNQSPHSYEKNFVNKEKF